MKRKIIFCAVFIMGLLSAFVLFSAAKMEASTSKSDAYKETMQDCGDKKSGTTMEFESLPGKFFSTLFIN